MKKILLSLALICALSIGKTSVYNANTDNPNEKVNYKKTEIKQNIDESETSILVEDTIEPDCKCSDKKCEKQRKNHKDKDKDLKQKEEGKKEATSVED